MDRTMLPVLVALAVGAFALGADSFIMIGMLSDIAADLDVIRLMADAFERIKVPVSRIDLGHVGIFRALAEAAGLPQESEENLLNLLQAKDVPGLIDAWLVLPGRTLLRSSRAVRGV